MQGEVSAFDEPSWTRRCPESRIGSHVGFQYRIVRHLASGGMADVFLAEHVGDEREVAVKLMASERGAPHGMLRHEAAVLTHLRHPNVQRLIEHGHAGSQGEYLLSDYIRGIDLDDWLLRCGPMLPSARTLRVLTQLAAALDHVHAQGIVHGDLKPANVMVDPNAGDRVTLIDLGLAFEHACTPIREAGVGTPGYMAPEQLHGGRCGPAADHYAFAAVSFELLTGGPLHPNAPSWYPGQCARVYTSHSLERSLTCHSLNAVFVRALHADPSERFPSAKQFVAAVAEALANRVVPARYQGCALAS